MRRVWLAARSMLLWILSWLHFVVLGGVLLILATLFGHRRVDPFVRWICRNIVRFTGARLEIRRAPGYDPARTCFYVANHVNVFDPFFLCASVPRLVRGLELESHFRVPVYGWIMKAMGNVPVPDERSAAALKRTYRLAGEALGSGISLVVFPEGSRTLDGSVGPFEDGGFRMAIQLGYPIVPVTQEGAFRLHRKGSRMLNPARVVLHFHEPIETEGLKRKDLAGLRQRVRAAIEAPLRAGPS